MNSTPGPWTITRLVSPDYALQFGIYAGPGPSVALVVNGNREANARLIAAAPDLLAALHLALPFIEDCAMDDCYKPGYVNKAIATIRAAIKKATGESA